MDDFFRICDPLQETEVRAVGSGPACTIVVNQGDDDPGGWRVELYAHFGSTRAFVQLVTINARALQGAPGRVVAIATIPGATGFSARVLPPLPPVVPPRRPIEIGLAADASSAANFVTVAP